MVNTRSPIEAALDTYVQVVGTATEQFQRQMDEATRLLKEAGMEEPTESAAPRPETGRSGTERRPGRRRPGIFD
ncbi:hypothetical protein BJF89_12240 [Corynebacterium sp. CNJ-954]|uniref:hypothetical protein n=1 Tax=Corynebacterium sp. CNJ-954 TaxID=1904962 RepID=UPI0009665FDA|nr:hypothetical protein [Corynebacterium sp. CNJ-954]OLT56181.1 hypothetical protein BJF89_12240 [Corynebacterium sp. CNJ-954]